jgi:4-amino-4-deoxy-L-arabinose transferase-like glycosyltransferase
MSVQTTAAGLFQARARNHAWPWNLWGVVSIGVLYGLVHACLRLSLSHNLPQDDVTANILAQTLEPGYIAKQPPLYEWLLWAVQRLTGPTLPSFLIIKYTLLTATFAFLYLAAKRIFHDARWAAIAGLSPLLLYQLGWNLHEGVTHTMVMVCAVAAALWAFMRIAERGELSDYLLFGLIAGLGLLSKYGFAAFLLLLLAAAALQPALRSRLVDWRMLAALLLAAAITSPLIYWLIAGGQDLVAVYQKNVAPQASDRLQATGIGLGMAVYAPFGFLFPLVLVLPVLFPRMLREAAASLKDGVNPETWGKSRPDWLLLILHITLGGFLVLILGALLTGASHYLERYMHPFFLLTPLWLLAMVERTGRPDRKLFMLSAVLVLVTAVVLPLSAYKLLRNMEHDCDKCRVAIPYAGLAQALETRGFRAGTLIATNRHDAGNLRRLFPEARVVCLRYPTYGPEVRAEDFSANAAIVWSAAESASVPKPAKRQLAALGLKDLPKPERVTVPW